MKIRIAAAGAALFAGLIMGTPAFAFCVPLWGTVCRPATSQPEDTAAASEAKPKRPLNLRRVAHKGGKHVRVATRHRHFRTAKYASRSAVAARSRIAAARRLAAARRHAKMEAWREAATRQAERTRREQAPPPVAAASPDAAPNGTAAAPETNGYVPSQNEVTELDLAADRSKVTPPAAQAPNPALWNAVAPTDPAANAGVDPSASAGGVDPATDGAKVAPAGENNVKMVATTNQAAAPAPETAVTPTATPAQQPADETSWLRRIVIGLGGMLTLASAVRLFAG